MPSVIINNLFKVSELIKLSHENSDLKIKTPPDEPPLNRSLLFERKIIQIKCKYQVINQFAKNNYFLQLHEGVGWDIYWTDRQFLSVRHLKSLMPYQRINYFPGMSILTNKQNLTERLNVYGHRFPEDYNFFPKTCVVRKSSPSNLSSDAMQMFSTSTHKIDESPLGQISIEPSHKLEDTDKNISGFQNKLSCDTGSSGPMSSTTENSLNNSTMTRSPTINNNKIIRDHSTFVEKPLQDITDRMQAIKQVPANTQKNIDLLLQVDDDENSSPIETKKHETGEKFFNKSKETKSKSLERNERPIVAVSTDNDGTNTRPKLFGIKSTNGFSQSNLRSTQNNQTKALKNKTPWNRISLGQILYKDNVKSMVMYLNSVNQTGKTGLLEKHNAGTKYNEQEKSTGTIEKTIQKEENALDEESDGAMDIQMKNVTNERKETNVIPESDPIYIFKPCDGCQGKGIKLAMNMGQIMNNMEFDSMICQQYIKNPLLWNGYKFDIRFYVLVTSVKRLRVYIYNEGIVRLATEKYEEANESNFDNMCMHLTNYSINKNSENFSQDLSKQSLERMNRFLQDEHGVDIPALYANIHDIIVKTILAGYKPILREYLDTFKNHVYREACFQLLGFDIILDTECNPFLLEINKNASLKRPTPIDREVKTKLTRDLFSILNLNENRLRGDILRDNLNHNTYRRRYIEHEEKHRGDFTMIYPCADEEKYAKFILD